MLGTLLESGPHRSIHPGETMLSALIHSALLTVAVALTVRAGEQIAEQRADDIIFAPLVEQKREEPPPPPEAPKLDQPAVSLDKLPPKGFQVLSAPIDIPNRIPEIDLSKSLTDEADFSGKGVQGGLARGVVGGLAKLDQAPDQPYLQSQVERTVEALPNNPVPRYPELMVRAQVEGVVRVQFIVDTLGRVEAGSIKVLSTPHPMLAGSVLDAVPKMRFRPAEISARKVRMLVEQPFEFYITVR